MTPKEKDQLLKLRRRRLTSHFDKSGYKCAWGPDWLDFEGLSGLVRVSWAWTNTDPAHMVTVINGVPVDPSIPDEVSILRALEEGVTSGNIV